MSEAVGVTTVPDSLVADVDTELSVADVPRMLEIMLARPVLAALVAVGLPVGETRVSVELTPVEADPVTPVPDGSKSETTLDTTPPVEAAVGEAVGVTVSEPVSVGEATGVVVGTRAVVRPETTLLRAGRRPESVALVGAVEAPVPEKDRPDATLSAVVVVGTVVSVGVGVTIPPGPKVTGPVLEGAAADAEVSIEELRVG